MADRVCSVDACGRPVQARGWCGTHYQRWRVHGDVQADVPVADLRAKVLPDGTVRAGCECSVEGCGRARHAHGLCQVHNERVSTHGDVLADVPVADRQPNRGPCAVNGCTKPSGKRVWCPMHYRRWRLTGDLRAEAEPRRWSATGICLVNSCGRKVHGKGLCNRHYRQTTRTGLQPMTGTCGRCGGEIDFTSTPTRTRRCGKCQRRKRKVTPADLVARDGTDCALCGCEVNLRIRYPDPLSPSVDHVIPWSAGGSDDISNLQLAHLRCNVRRGARVDAPVGLLLQTS